MADTAIPAGAIYDAVAGVFGNEGRMLTGFVGIVTYITPEGERAWGWSVDPNQGPEVTIGLIGILESISTRVTTAVFDLTALEGPGDD